MRAFVGRGACICASTCVGLVSNGLPQPASRWAWLLVALPPMLALLLSLLAAIAHTAAPTSGACDLRRKANRRHDWATRKGGKRV